MTCRLARCLRVRSTFRREFEVLRYLQVLKLECGSAGSRYLSVFLVGQQGRTDPASVQSPQAKDIVFLVCWGLQAETEQQQSGLEP